MLFVLSPYIGSTLFAAFLLAGYAARPTAAPSPPAPDRVVLLSAGDPEYTALAVPGSLKTVPEAPMHLVVFHGGVCVRDIGLVPEDKRDQRATAGAGIVEETGTIDRAFVAEDGAAAVLAKTRYVSRVDVTPGETSTANDTVTGDTTLTLIDPLHPRGFWSVVLENARWVKDVLVLPGSAGVALTSFLPRNGPADFRILDAAGRESLRVAESAAETLRIAAPPAGGYVAAEVAFRDSDVLPERGVIVFDLARGTQWTYGWRYGSDAEPVSWELQNQGVLAVKLPSGVRRFGATGRRL
jgi:hypothetical protein